MHVADLHAAAEILVAEVLVAVVDAVIAVELVHHIVELGEDEAVHRVVQTEFVEHVAVLPCDVGIARGAVHAPDHAALGVHQRRAVLAVLADVVELAAHVGVLAHLVHVILDHLVGVQIEMPGVYVGLHVVVIAGRVVLDDAGGVVFLGLLPDAAHPFLGLGQVLAVGPFAGEQAPGLVEHYPCEDAGVVVVALELAGPLGFVGGAGFGVGLAPEAGDVLHDEHAQLIHPVELAGLLALDVDARHIEAESLEPPCLVAHVLIGGIGEMALGMERLVEGAVDIDGLAVEQYAAVLCGDLADAEVGLHGILAQRDRALIELGGIGGPQPGLGEVHIYGRAAIFDGAGELAAVEACGDGCAVGGAGLYGEGHVAVDAGDEAERIDVLGAAVFEPHGLPDALDIAVALLAVGLGLVAEVLAADDDLVFACVPHVGHVHVELIIAALMSAQEGAVYVHVGYIIRRADAQECAALGVECHVLFIPADALHVLAHAGKGAAPGKGHGYF